MLHYPTKLESWRTIIMELFLIEIYEVKTNTIYNYANQLTINIY